MTSKDLKMEVPFRSQFDSRYYAFFMTFEPQNITGTYDGDTHRLNIQAVLKRELHKETQAQDLYPIVLDLHGKLYPMNHPHENGAALQPIVDLPINLVSPNVL